MKDPDSIFQSNPFTDKIEVTEALIDRLMSLRGGHTRAVLLAIGAGWPAVKGWKHRAIGNTVSGALIRSLVEDMRRRERFLLPTETGTEAAAISRLKQHTHADKKRARKERRSQKKMTKRTRMAMQPRRTKPTAGAVIGRPTDYRVTRDAFLASDQWKKLRYATLQKFGAQCQACNSTRKEGRVMHVDHIKPMWTHWQLRAEPANLQVLCEDCNMGKGAWDDTDWR